MPPSAPWSRAVTVTVRVSAGLSHWPRVVSRVITPVNSRSASNPASARDNRPPSTPAAVLLRREGPAARINQPQTTDSTAPAIAQEPPSLASRHSPWISAASRHRPPPVAPEAFRMTAVKAREAAPRTRTYAQV